MDEQRRMQRNGFYRKTDEGLCVVEAIGIDREDDLEFWIQLCLDFNPLAKRSKKRAGK
ncbi:MAG: hypothetical protein IH948_07550 [Bacteroidetes bacterium]|nr:hypothetical protein [Bacteroidota bacterium]